MTAQRGRRLVHPTGVGMAALALAFAGVSVWAAVSVRYCPENGDCAWTPGWGLTAAGVALLAFAATQRFVSWARRGRGAWQGVALLVAAVAGGAVWVLAAIASLVGDV